MADANKMRELARKVIQYAEVQPFPREYVLLAQEALAEQPAQGEAVAWLYDIEETGSYDNFTRADPSSKEHAGNIRALYTASAEQPTHGEKGMSVKDTRQILANELGLSREVVEKIIREQVSSYIAELGGLDGVLRHTAREEVRTIARNERRQFGSLESVVAQATREALLPVIRDLLVKNLEVPRG